MKKKLDWFDLILWIIIFMMAVAAVILSSF